MMNNNDSVRATLVNGDSDVCKALLFECAISWAKEGHYVYYFASKPLESLPLSFHDRSEPSADVLKIITFIYTPTYDDLACQLVRLHVFKRPASVLLIDDLDTFAGADGNVALQSAKCCAVILNAARTCSELARRQVLVCAASFEREIRSTYEMYFDNRWTVHSEPGDRDTDEARRVWIRNARDRRALEYCRLDDAVLVLKGVYAADDGGEDAASMST